MAVSDTTLAKRALQGAFDGCIDPRAVMAEQFRDVERVTITDGGTAGNTVAEEPVMTARVAQSTATGWVAATRTVTRIVGVLPVAFTQSATVFATFTVSKRTAGGAAVVIGTAKTDLVANGGVGTLAAFVPFTFTLSTVAGATTLASDDVVTLILAKASTGTAIASATAQAVIQIESEAV